MPKEKMTMPLYQSLDDRLKNQHEAIRNIIKGLDENRLLARPEPGKWSIHDNIAHLAKLQSIYIERIDKILSHEDPLLQDYAPEQDPDLPAWMNLNTDALLERMNSDRKQIYAIITSLSDKQLARIGTHTTRGRLPLSGWIEMMILHEAHHIWTIFKLVHNGESK